jgi:chromosome segregation ATPase
VLHSTAEALTQKESHAEPRSGLDELQLFICQQMANLEGDSTVWALSAGHAASWSNHERQNLLQELPRWQRRVEELEKAMGDTMDHLARVSESCDSRLQSQPHNNPSMQGALHRWGAERQRLLEELAACQNRATTLETRQRDLIMTVAEMQGIQERGVAASWAARDSHDSKDHHDSYSHHSQDHTREQSPELGPGQTAHDALASAKSRVAHLERRQETLQSTLSAVSNALQNRDAMESTWQQEKADLVNEIHALRHYAEQLVVAG